MDLLDYIVVHYKPSQGTDLQNQLYHMEIVEIEHILTIL